MGAHARRASSAQADRLEQQRQKRGLRVAMASLGFRLGRFLCVCLVSVIHGYSLAGDIFRQPLWPTTSHKGKLDLYGTIFTVITWKCYAET